MITKKKLSYEAPSCEMVELQIEAVMQGGSPNDPNRLNSPSRGYNNGFDEDGNDLGII